jgi:hypothetical protein
MTHLTPVPASGWRTNGDDSLICPHRDVTVCPDCERTYAAVTIDVYGRLYYDPDGALRDAMKEPANV